MIFEYFYDPKFFNFENHVHLTIRVLLMPILIYLCCLNTFKIMFVYILGASDTNFNFTMRLKCIILKNMFVQKIQALTPFVCS